jgi:hypothetical protein
VHEATHARLWHSGIGYEEPIRGRVEAVCFRRERAFAARLPDGEEIRRIAEAKLAYYTNETLTGEALHARHREGAAQALRDLGQPEWLIRATFGFNDRGVGSSAFSAPASPSPRKNPYRQQDFRIFAANQW